MIRAPIGRRRALLAGTLSIVFLLCAYTILSEYQHAQNEFDTTIPTWKQLGEGVRTMLAWDPSEETRWLWGDATATIGRLFTGLIGGVAGGFVLGLLMGCFRTWEAFLSPPLTLFAKIPPTAMLAVFFVLTDSFYTAMVVFGIMPAIAQSVYIAIREVPSEMIDKAYTLGASHGEVIGNVIVPHILPTFIDTIRLQIGPAMVYLIAAEMVEGSAGLGYRIRMRQRLSDMAVVYPYLAFLAAFGFAMDWLLRVLQHRVCPWYAGRRG